MLKDIIVNLTVDAAHDVAADYAISVARTFQAHLTSIGFAFEPVIPGSVMGSMAVELIETQRKEFERAARSAVGDGEEGARRGGGAAEPRRATGGGRGVAKGVAGRGGRRVRRAGPPLRSCGRGAGRAEQAAGPRADHRGRAVRIRPAGADRALYPARRAQARPRDGVLGRRP